MCGFERTKGQNLRLGERMIKQALICGLAASVGLYALNAESLGFKAAKEAVKEAGNKAIDRFIPGGDHRVARDIWGDVVDGHLGRAAFRAGFEPSEISTKQGEPGTPLQLPSRQDVTDKPVVPASPANENAVPAHGPDGRSGVVERSVTPSLPADVGRTVVTPDHGGDRGQGNQGGGGGHQGGWAGGDHPSHGNVA